MTGATMTERATSDKHLVLIGLMGAGREVTTIYTTGSSGTLVDITGSNWSQRGSAPVGRFTVHGGSAGAGVSGLRYGDRAIGTGDWTLAAQHYRRALELSPSLMPIWVQLGHALKEKGEHSGAEAAYRHALSLDEARADTHLQLAHLLKLQARWEEAADAYLRALQLDATLKEAGSELDTICARFVEEGDKARDARSWAEAVRHYRRALARRAELTPIWVQLGNALKEHGDYIEAEAAYRHAVAIDPSLPDGHLQLGHLLKVRARRSQAIDAYATAVRLDPDLVAAREALHALLGYSPSEAEQAILANGESLRDIPPGDERAGHKGNGHAARLTRNLGR